MTETDVVLIDDDPMIRFLVQEYLTAFHYSVKTFDNGGCALEGLKEVSPKIILLDLQMPMMNGFEVLDKLRQDPRFEGVKIVMLSANASDAAHLEGPQPDAYLEKPFQMDALLRTVADAKPA